MGTLTLDDRTELLKKVGIFTDAGENVIQSIAEVLEEVPVRQGRTVIKKGSTGDSMYIMAEGKVRIHDGNHVHARLEKGQVFGEYALIDQSDRSASVTADIDSLLLKLDAKDFYRLAAENHNILRGVLKVLIGRIRYMNELEERLSKSYLKIRNQNEKIEKQNLNIKAQKEQLEQQNYDLIRVNEEKNHLISTIIHQLRNPLASSLTLVEMITQQDISETNESDAMEIIERSLRRINNLITEILDINSINSKVFELKYEQINLKHITEEIIENYRVLLEQKNISLESSIQNIETELNRVYFTQIVDNLLSNAIKFTSAGKNINLLLERSDRMIRLVIKDEGKGIEAKRIPDIFNQYRRQTGMKEQAEPASGLGLAIVKKYSEEMGGIVECESVEGQGSTFTVIFRERP